MPYKSPSRRKKHCENPLYRLIVGTNRADLDGAVLARGIGCKCMYILYKNIFSYIYTYLGRALRRHPYLSPDFRLCGDPPALASYCPNRSFFLLGRGLWLGDTTLAERYTGLVQRREQC